MASFAISLRAWAKRNRAFLLIVIVPTLVTAAYYYLVAADQYQSEAHFVVRTADSSPGLSSGFGQFLGMTPGISQTRSDALSVNDYLDSQDAVLNLNRRVNIIDRFRRPEADIATRLQSAYPTPEALLKYYRKQVSVHFDSDSGITKLQVRTFRPADSYAIIKQLMLMGEQRVNLLNQRSLTDTLSSAGRQLADAETALAAFQVRMTSFRQQRGDIDPEGSGRAQIGLVSTLSIALTQARAQLASMQGIISPSSPQYVATAARVRALSAQVAGQSGKLVVGGDAIAANLGNYEDLKVRQEFAAKRYEAAAANLEKARDQASKQQLYIVRVVEPNLPVKSQFPERGRIVLTVFFSLLITYAIGWLVMAGVKEHSL
jgi:capsular polysaccharide transport system permease protein